MNRWASSLPAHGRDVGLVRLGGHASRVIGLPPSMTTLTSEVLAEILLVDILTTTLLGLDPTAARRARRDLIEYRQFLHEADPSRAT